MYYSATQKGLVVTTQHCPEQPYVSLQLPIINDGRGDDTQSTTIPQALTVRRVVFTTVSHDQGFASNEDQLGGTYVQSYTWVRTSF